MSGSVSADLRTCLTYSENFLGLLSSYNWINLTETYSESLTISATVTGVGQFDLNDFDSPIALLTRSLVTDHDLITIAFVPIVEESVWINLSAEYQIEMNAGSSITIHQGMDGVASQEYNFSRSAWTTSETPSCLVGTVSAGCATLSTSSSFGGNFTLRIGPLVGAKLIIVAGFAGNTVWAFLYDQVTGYFGRDFHKDTDLSNAGDGGQCGGSYSVEGLPTTLPHSAGSVSLRNALEAQLSTQGWSVICAAVGVQFGATWYAVGGLWGGQTGAPPQVVTYYAGPLAASIVMCDATLRHCTSTFSGSSSPYPVHRPYSWSMTEGGTDTFYVLSPLILIGSANALGPTLPATAVTPVQAPSEAPSCGIVTSLEPGQTEWNYTAPSASLVCQLNFTDGLPFALSPDQVSAIVIWINVEAAPVFVDEPSELEWQFAHPFRGAVGYPAFNGHWSIQLVGCPTCDNQSGQHSQPPSYFETSTNDTITFPQVRNGTYNYTITPPSGATPANDTGTVTVSAGGYRFVPVGLGPLEIHFEESGLSKGSLWSVAIDGVDHNSTTSEIDFNATPGTYLFTIGKVPGSYASPASTGNVSVNATDVSVPVLFVQTPTQGAVPPKTSLVTFREVGLGPNEAWSVVISPGVESTAVSPTFDLTKGTYHYEVASPPGIRATPHSGQLVVGATGTAVKIKFAPVPYSVTFSEVGLPTGKPWKVTLSGTNTPAKGLHASSRGSTTGFAVPNGTYSYSVHPVKGFTASWRGSVDVNGTATIVPVLFDSLSYVVVLNETGLPANANFSATVGGVIHAVNVEATWATLFWFPGLTNGSHKFTVQPPPGFTAKPDKGTIAVHGKTVRVNVRFRALPISSDRVDRSKSSNLRDAGTLERAPIRGGSVPLSDQRWPLVLRRTGNPPDH